MDFWCMAAWVNSINIDYKINLLCVRLLYYLHKHETINSILHSLYT